MVKTIIVMRMMMTNTEHYLTFPETSITRSKTAEMSKYKKIMGKNYVKLNKKKLRRYRKWKAVKCFHVNNATRFLYFSIYT